MCIALVFFFFNDTATTEIYTLSLHDALPIWARRDRRAPGGVELGPDAGVEDVLEAGVRDRKSTRLNSSHSQISYAAFCLKKKKNRRRFAEPEHCAPCNMLDMCW